jgi:NitT/TauT family transport system substrate-binding protein
LVPELWGSTFVKEIDANVILDFNKLWREGKYSTAVVVARKDFIKKHPELVEKFLKIHVELTNILVKQDEQIKQTINNQINDLTKKSLPKDVFDAAYNRMTPTYDPEQSSINDFIDLSVEIGTLKEKPYTDKLFYLSILNKVLKEN